MSNKFSERNLGDNSLRKKAKGLEDRMKDIETGFSRLVVGIDQRMNNIGQALAQNSEVIEAIIEHVGADAINDIVESKRLERAEKAALAEQEALTQAIADGYVTPVDVIAEDSFIVGLEFQANDKPLGTGRQQVAFESLSATAKTELLGKPLGTVVKTPVGGTFQVKEIYKLDKELGMKVLQEKAAKQQEEAQKAAEEVAAKDEE